MSWKSIVGLFTLLLTNNQFRDIRYNKHERVPRSDKILYHIHYTLSYSRRFRMLEYFD